MAGPDSSVGEHPHRGAVVMGTLMPHMSAQRHQVYRNATALVLLAALLAAGLGSLSIALVLAAIALPAVVLTYIHDHRLWRDEPVTVIVVTFLLSLVLGIGVGLLETYFIPGVALPLSHGRHAQLPSVSQILELGVLVPVVAFVAVLIAPIVVTSRAAFTHPMDVVVTCSLSGAALSLGLSVVVQHGAFTQVQATAGDPARVAFIALTLGFLQPIVLATAAAVTLLGLRTASVSAVVGVIKGAVLVILYELGTTLLQPLGARGVVLIALVAFVLAGVGLAAARAALHAALSADDSGAGAGVVEHRLHAAVVTAIIAVVVIIAAGVTAVVVCSGPAKTPTPPAIGGTYGRARAQASGSVQPGIFDDGGNPRARVVLASTMTALADTNASTFDFGGGITMTIAPGWTISQQNSGWVAMLNGDKSVGMYAVAGGADTADINSEAALLIKNEIKTVGFTNVQQDQQATVLPVKGGKNFLQSLAIAYTANLQTNQGTQQGYGVWITLFNQSTKTAAFIDADASNLNALQRAYSSDIVGMINSMV